MSPTVSYRVSHPVAIGNQQCFALATALSGGAVVERVAYQAYGLPTFINVEGTTLSSSAKRTRYSFTGRESDALLVLHHFRARWMSGVSGRFSGRFSGRDSIGYLDGMSLFEFVASNPIASIDPSGRTRWDLRMQSGYVPPKTSPYIGGSDVVAFTTKTKRCIFYREPFPLANGDIGVGIGTIPVNGGVRLPYTTKDDILRKIESNKCCEVVFAGHQGGEENEGGVKEIFSCNPYDGNFASQLYVSFKKVGCGGCSIFLAACSASGDDADCRRTALAWDSHCGVYGSTSTVTYWPGDPKKNPNGPWKCATLDNKCFGKSCEKGSECRYGPWAFFHYPSTQVF